MAAQHSTHSDFTSRYKFNGKELDQETGWYYYGARYYDPAVSQWLNIDPLAEKYPGMSPYNYTANNPVMLVDPDGKGPEDDYHIKSDGSISVTLTNDNFDRFFLTKNGKETLIGKFNKNSHGLIQLNDFAFINYDYNISFNVKDGNENKCYIRGDALASLFGALSETGYNDITIIGVSKEDGSSPRPSVSHINGKNIDFRYLRTDKNGERVLLGQEKFDMERQNKFNDALFKFGWKNLLSEKFVPYGEKKNVLLNHTHHYNKSRHNNHLHSQGYNPNLTYYGGVLPPVYIKK